MDFGVGYAELGLEKMFTNKILKIFGDIAREKERT